MNGRNRIADTKLPSQARKTLVRALFGQSVIDRIAIAFCLAAIFYVLTGFASHAGPKILIPDQLSPATGQPGIAGTAFAPDAVPDMSRPAYLKGPLEMYGSFLENGDSMGTIRTAIYKAVPDFYMFVSGYPNRPGNHLLLEVFTRKSGVVRLQVAPFEDTGRKWLLKRISLRQIEGATGFRIIGTDANKGPEGWLGFSLPFEDEQPYGRSGLLIVKQLGFCLLAMMAAFVALLAPGFMLRQWVKEQRGFLFSLIWVAVPGLLGLALLAVLAWFGPRHIKSAVICRIVLLIFFGFSAWRFSRFRLSGAITGVEKQVLLAVLVLSAVCAAKSIYSLGPVGELYHDEISRTLEIGGRSDSRLPYYVSQLIGLRQSTSSPFAGELYATWTFSDRGQLAALAAAPLVLAGPTRMPNNKPEEAWTVFDPEGFAAYRLSMIVFAASLLFFVFGLAALFVSADWALFAVLVTATAPFIVHDTYYTWPKLEAAAFVLLAGYLVLQSRFLFGGLALGLGYMCHPSALLSAPTILFLVILLPKFNGARLAFSWAEIHRVLWSSLLVLVGLAVWLAFWRIANGANYTQSKFLHYAAAAGGMAPTPTNWFKYRFDSLLTTFVPLYQFFFHAADDNVNATEGPSPAVIRFFVQPWSTVPFAAGFAYFFCMLRFIYLGFTKARSWLILMLVIAVLIFTAYMGIDSSGTLKEGLHAWFLTLLIFTVVIWKKYGTQSQTFWRICNWALLTRAVDLLLMMILPVIWTQYAIVLPPFALTDVLALGTMVGGVLWLCIYMFRYAEGLRLKHVADE